MKRIAGFLLLALWWLPASTAVGSEWRIDDDHSNAYFSVLHLTISKVRGTFSAVSGSAVIDDDSGLLKKLDLTVRVDSIDTGVDKRDEDLKSPNFLDAAKDPTITFTTKNVEDMGYGTLVLTGDLTIHGVTREVAVTAYGPTPEIKDPWGMTRRGLRLGYKLNRRDYGINDNKVLDSGGMVIANVVDTEADLELVRK